MVGCKMVILYIECLHIFDRIIHLSNHQTIKVQIFDMIIEQKRISISASSLSNKFSFWNKNVNSANLLIGQRKIIKVLFKKGKHFKIFLFSIHNSKTEWIIHLTQPSNYVDGVTLNRFQFKELEHRHMRILSCPSSSSDSLILVVSTQKM